MEERRKERAAQAVQAVEAVEASEVQERPPTVVSLSRQELAALLEVEPSNASESPGLLLEVELESWRFCQSVSAALRKPTLEK